MRRRRFVSPVDRATYQTLHTVSLATRSLRDGLTPEGAARATKHLRSMLGSEAVAITDTGATLAWDGAGAHHRGQVHGHAQPVLTSGRTLVLTEREIACGDPDCPITSGILVPIFADDHVVAISGG